jgi:hypothetical protein
MFTGNTPIFSVLNNALMATMAFEQAGQINAPLGVELLGSWDFSVASITGLDIGDITSLQTTLNGKATKNISTSSHTQPNHNHSIPEGASWTTSLGTVTWSASGGFTHSHTQN